MQVLRVLSINSEPISSWWLAVQGAAELLQVTAKNVRFSCCPAKQARPACMSCEGCSTTAWLLASKAAPTVQLPGRRLASQEAPA